MQAAMQLYAEEVRRRHGVVLRIRVGLNAGEVVVRAIGNDLHMDYSAVGQTVHLAARMEQLAPPGSILLTAAALRLVEGLVRVNALGPLPVKGLSEPVEVFELIGTSAIRRRLQAAATRGLTRFVGRQTELAVKPWSGLVRGTARRPQWSAKAALGSRAWSTSSFMPIIPATGWCSSAPLSPMARRRHTSRWLISSSATSTWTTATIPGPFGPR